MFGRKKSEVQNTNHDIELMMSMMDKVIEGDFSEIDVSPFVDKRYGEKINGMIQAFKKANNNFVMRLNEAMESIGDNSYVKNTFDQVQSQYESINDMEEASHHLETSINDISTSMEDIRDNTHDILDVIQKSAVGMNESIQVVNESSEKINVINGQMQKFQDKIQKIGEIVDIVKAVASQSNLLALNASIEAARAGEAGKGFAVVADQVRELSSNTSTSAGDIVKYVNELRNDITELAQLMDDTTTKLAEGNSKVEGSLNDINRMTNQMEIVKDKVDNIFKAIDKQTTVTASFSNQVENIAVSYDELTKDCMAQGTHVYKISRYIDTTRSDMVRDFANVTTQDWLKIFEIDHFILMWRVYSNEIGFEQLKITQLNNPTSCKLGIWLGKQTDPAITGSQEFAAVKNAHNELHRCATESWKAKDAGNTEKAKECFKNTYDAFYVYRDAIRKLQDKLMTLGYTDKTKIVVFRN